MTIQNWLHSFLFGGIIAVGLSYFFAHYFSASLFIFYQDWTGWRSITGSSPNQITHGLEKISWALLFCSCWWMIWRLDKFICNSVGGKKGSNFLPEDDSPSKAKEKKVHMDPDFRNFKSENFEPEEDLTEDEPTPEPHQKNTYDNDADDTQKITFPDVEELEMAELLGLTRDDLKNFTKIKATYRNAIAQYHPDKVSSLGPEIREVADKKAKEINQAYEFFRKKFQQH